MPGVDSQPTGDRKGGVVWHTQGSGRTDEEIETAIRHVIDKALVLEQVIDVFDAAGIKKPDISILSEDFLLEVQNMKRQECCS